MEGVIALMIPIVAIVMIFGIPIAGILTHHQRKMAEMIHNRNQENNPQMQSEIHQLRQEVSYLREMLNEQQIALDDLRNNSGPIVSSDDLNNLTS